MSKERDTRDIFNGTIGKAIPNMVKALAEELGIEVDVKMFENHSEEDCAKCDSKDRCPGSKVKGSKAKAAKIKDATTYEPVTTLAREDIAKLLKLEKAKAIVDTLSRAANNAMKEYNTAANLVNKDSKDFWDNLCAKYGLDPAGDYCIDNETFTVEKAVSEDRK